MPLSISDLIEDESLDLPRFVFSVFKSCKKDLENIFPTFEKEQMTLFYIDKGEHNE